MLGIAGTYSVLYIWARTNASLSSGSGNTEAFPENVWLF